MGQKTLFKTINERVFTIRLWIAVVASCFATHTVYGQTPVEPESIQLEGIIVTARQIEEPLAKVPFSISVVTRDDIGERQIHSSSDLFRAVPNFNYTDSGLKEANLLNMRGIGASSTFLSPSITYYVDGVPISARAFDQNFLDVSRIEILRGPQGTLFGQNAQAGAVNIISAAPTEKTALELGGEYSNFNMYRLNAMASGRISQNAFARINGQFYSRDGDIRNILFSNPTTITSDERSIREEMLGAVNGKLKLTPSADTTLTFSGRYQHDKQYPTTGLLLNDSDFPRNALTPRPENTIDSSLASMKIEHQFSGIKLTSITGFHGYDLSLRADITDGFIASQNSGFPASVFQFPNSIRLIDEDSTQWSQEVRLDGTTKGGTRWVIGFSGLYSEFSSTTDITSPQLANGAYRGKIDKLNLAAFGEVTIPIHERFRLIGGLRLTNEENDFSGQFTGRPGGAPAVASFSEAGRTEDTFVTGRAGLSYDLQPGLTSYATIARGEKAGGFPFFNQSAAFSIANTPYQSSSTWSYETGLRGTLFDKRLRIGLSVFFNDTSDEQLFIFNPLVGQFQVENADTESYGAEFEFAWKPVSSFTLSGNLGLLRAEVTKASLGGSVREGNDVPYAPHVTGSLAGQYVIPAAELGLRGDIVLRAEYQYVGNRKIDPANTASLKEYSIVNLRLAYKTGRYTLYTYANNVFDEDYVSSAFRAGANASGTPTIAGVPGLPRMFGIGAKLQF